MGKHLRRDSFQKKLICVLSLEHSMRFIRPETENPPLRKQGTRSFYIKAGLIEEVLFYIFLLTFLQHNAINSVGVHCKLLITR